MEKNFFTSNADRQFYLNNVIDWKALGADNRKEEFEMILSTVGDLAVEIAGRAKENDNSEYRIENGRLVWPEGIRKNYESMKEIGLICPTISEENGGLGFPTTLNTIIEEMLFQADAGFATIPLLQSGVAEIIESFGSEELKQEYLPKMLSGEWTGCMDLTEPGAGSDLGGITTKAEKKGEKTLINGSKIFITNGGAEAHLVLARDEDVFEETKGKTSGISMYLVPSTKENSNGTKVTRLEEKLGIHSSPTCAITFDEAEGYLVGEKGEGLKQMFKLMNNARLGVAAQALGIIEASYELAREYAEERKQFGKPIKELGAVKELLTEIKIQNEAVRALVYGLAFAIDMKKKDESCKNKAGVLTFAAKYYAAEKAVELSRKALQVLGGVGYTTDYPAERHVRDSIITSIYEGTSQIQAVQLVANSLKAAFGRKNVADASQLMDEMEKGLKDVADADAQKVMFGIDDVRKSLEVFKNYIAKTISPEQPSGDLESVFSQAEKFAMLTAEVCAGYSLLKQAEKDERKKLVSKNFLQGMQLRAAQYSLDIAKLNEDTLEEYDEIIS